MSYSFNPLDHPILFLTPRRLGLSESVEHLPLLFYLMEIVHPNRPNCIVQLGSRTGIMYCGLCQAAQQLRLETECYLVLSSSSGGSVEAMVLEEWSAHHAQYYGHFSKLLDGPWDNALLHFDDGSIDLLYIQDPGVTLDPWIPKMSRSGVIAFEDPKLLCRAQLRLMDVRGLSLSFAGQDTPKCLVGLANASEPELESFRRFFRHLGQNFRNLVKPRMAQTELIQVQNSLEAEKARVQHLEKEISLFFRYKINRQHDSLVSIVIPVFNQPELTQACLDSIRTHTSYQPYELIIIDNGSDEATKRVLSTIKEVRVLTNESNVGFVEACNQGAGHAKGDYLLFLNNDTRVTPGWFSVLVRTLQSDDRIGAVGAMLLCPDGKLQEAGSIVWSDGSALNYGGGDNPARAEYNYVREVDYCSGACLLVRKDVFQKVGGFDTRYSPAYYEDTDLCFEIRKLGYKVIYQPKARVTHMGGATAGTDLAKSFKRYAVLNKPKFIEKHSYALARQWPNTPENIFKARERIEGLRILILDQMVPRPDEDCGSCRMFEMLKILRSMGHKVTLGTHSNDDPEKHMDAVEQSGVELIRGESAIWPYLQAHAGHFDIAICCRVPIAMKYTLFLRQKNPLIKIIFDSIYLQFLQEVRQGILEGDEKRLVWAQTVKHTEDYLYKVSDLVWVVSTYERDLLLKESPSLPVAVVPIIHFARQCVPPFDAREGIMFLGGFMHSPNEDAVLYFVDEILPLIRRELGDFAFYVVGSNPPESITRLASDRIIVTGYVPDLAEYFDRCRVFVAPIRYGSGIKGKIGQSLAHGVPVVTTTIGAEGMGLKEGETVLLADEPMEFARKVQLIYEDKAFWAELSANGLRHILENASPEMMKRRLERIFSMVMRNHWQDPIADHVLMRNGLSVVSIQIS